MVAKIIQCIIIADSNCEGDKYVKQKDEVYQFSFDMQCNEKIINLLQQIKLKWLDELPVSHMALLSKADIISNHHNVFQR